MVFDNIPRYHGRPCPTPPALPAPSVGFVRSARRLEPRATLPANAGRFAGRRLPELFVNHYRVGGFTHSSLLTLPGRSGPTAAVLGLARALQRAPPRSLSPARNGERVPAMNLVVPTACQSARATHHWRRLDAAACSLGRPPGRHADSRGGAIPGAGSLHASPHPPVVLSCLTPASAPPGRPGRFRPPAAENDRPAPRPAPSISVRGRCQRRPAPAAPARRYDQAVRGYGRPRSVAGAMTCARPFG